MLYATLFSIGLAIALFLCMFARQSFKETFLNWKPSAVFICFTLFIPFISPQANSQVVSLGLKVFRIGGMVDVEVKRISEESTIAKGKLLLQTPENLYIEDSTEGLTTIPYSSEIYLHVTKQ